MTGRKRHGLAAIYLVLFMVALCAICSLGVDLGRVQLVKTELLRAADASARAAVSRLPDVNAAASEATVYAQSNSADGSPVAINPSDIEFGTWDPANLTFAVLTGTARNDANAVRVTARRTAGRGNATPLLFASVLGINTCNTTSSAIATLVSPNHGPGVVGIDSVEMNGGDRIDSYDSTKGAYAAQAPGANVGVASNGAISMNGSCGIQGDAYYTTGQSPPTGNISGTKYPMSTPLNYPAPILPASYIDHGNISLCGGQSMTLVGGTHYCSSLLMSGNTTLNVTGAVKLYVQGSLEMNGNSMIALAGNSPANLEIYVLGSGPVDLSKNNLYATLYCPNSPVTMNGNCDLFGSIIAKSILMNGNNTIHYDEALGSGAAGPKRIVVVR